MRRVTSVQNNAMAVGQGPLPPNVMEILRQYAWERNFYPA
jgi:hypothetical protein